MVLEKTLKSSLNWKEIQPVHPKGNQSWIVIGRTDAEAEAPILWPPDGKSWLTGKDPDAGEDWRQAKKGMTEDDMVGWHHWLDEHEFEQAPEVGDGQGSLVFCSPWGRRVRHDWATELRLEFQGKSRENQPSIPVYPCSLKLQFLIFSWWHFWGLPGDSLLQLLYFLWYLET